MREADPDTALGRGCGLEPGAPYFLDPPLDPSILGLKLRWAMEKGHHIGLSTYCVPVIMECTLYLHPLPDLQRRSCYSYFFRFLQMRKLRPRDVGEVVQVILLRSGAGI